MVSIRRDYRTKTEYYAMIITHMCTRTTHTGIYIRSYVVHTSGWINHYQCSPIIGSNVANDHLPIRVSEVSIEKKTILVEQVW